MVEDHAKRLRQAFAPQGIGVAVLYDVVSLAKGMELLGPCPCPSGGAPGR